jgi:hypothetical protein
MTMIDTSTSGVSAFQAEADTFKDEAVELLNVDNLTLAASIGHQTGLFDTLSILPPATAKEIARVADLAEPYVQIWLDAMAIRGVVEHNDEEQHYALPPDSAGRMLAAGDNVNLSFFHQLPELRDGSEDWIVECFQATSVVASEETGLSEGSTFVAPERTRRTAITTGLSEFLATVFKKVTASFSRKGGALAYGPTLQDNVRLISDKDRPLSSCQALKAS